MKKFAFDFIFQDFAYRAECLTIAIDGSTELHVTPLDLDLFESFGNRILLLNSDGTITASVPAPSEERDYIMSLAEGLSDHFT